MLTDAIREQIISIIDGTQYMTIATVREDGYPQATTVSYANDGLVIYFGASADSQKAQNIARCNKVSLTINRVYNNWDDIEGLSLGGIAMLVSDPKEQGMIGEMMFKKFPQIAHYVPTAADYGALFRIEPEVISVLDYSKGFGHTELVKL